MNISYGGIFDYSKKEERLHLIKFELKDPNIWKNPERAQHLGKEKKSLEKTLKELKFLKNSIKDTIEFLNLAEAEGDDYAIKSIEKEISAFEKEIERLEFNRIFSNPKDSMNCFLDLQSGAGGTESQDWASMLLRQYLRYSDRKGFSAEILEESSGEITGIKSATVKITGDYAFGYLRTESGVHRLVRKSPFDSSGNRHTSFASVFVYPEIDHSFKIDINQSDIRVDTYRASGAGGQHVNKTDSAIRLTHFPTGIVVQCQNDRSQHRNRHEAMNMLKSKLYELGLQNQIAEQKKMEDEKNSVCWGNQIRSYILDQSRIKDLRTRIETSNIQSVLDGDLDIFIMESLRQKI